MLALAGLNRWRLTPALGVAIHIDDLALAVTGLRGGWRAAREPRPRRLERNIGTYEDDVMN